MMAKRVSRLLRAGFVILAGVCAATDRLDSAPRAGPVPLMLAENVAAASGLAAAETGAVTLRAALSRVTYSRSLPQNLLLKLDYAATDAALPERQPLNIALVLDRSGSMAEDKKFPYTLEAARLVIENMSERDVLSIVAFNEKVTVLAAAGHVVNKQFLFHRLEDVEPEGYTDLSAGLLEGIAQVDSQRTKGQLGQVLLLTDGLANRGVTAQAALRSIVEKARARDVGVSTFGCGTQFNEKLLSDMAGGGGGRYTYIKTPEQIPQAFHEELRGLLQVVAQNVAVEIAVTGGQITKVYGELPTQPTRSYKFTVGNLRAAERGVALLELKPDRLETAAAVDAEVRLTFDDPQAGQRLTRVARQRCAFTAGAEPVELKEDPAVVLYGRLLATLEKAIEAVRGLDTERTRQVRAVFDQLHEQARQHALQNRDQELLNQAFLLKHFIEELTAAEGQGLLHGHSEAREKLKKEADYQRYLLLHHRRAH